MTIRQFIKKLFVTIIMIGIVLAAVLKVGYILICKVIVVIIFVVLAIQYWVGEDIRKAEEEKRGTWLFTLGFIGLTVLTMLAANIPGQVQRDQYLYLTKEHTEQLEKVLLREATADSERCIQWYEKQMLGIRNNKALGNPAMQTEDERRYKNRIDGKEVYRDPDTCTLRVKELKDGSTKDSVLINGPVGEIIAMRERIFYIDMEDHNVLKSVTYDGRKRKTWTKDPVKQFAVIGEYVICCTEDEKLIRCDMSTGKRKELADHIQYFFAGAKLYAQKGSKIVSVSYDGKEIRVFKKDVVMMDKKEDKVYYRRMDRELQKGDIVFFRRKSGQFVMHRIWKIRPEGYYIVGDAQTQIEGPVKREQIFALITKVRRKEKWLEPGDFWWEFFEHVWLHMIPLRRGIMWCYAKVIK